MDQAALQRDTHQEDKNLSGLFTYEADLRYFLVKAVHSEGLFKSGS